MLPRWSFLASFFAMTVSAQWHATGPWGGAAELVRIAPGNPDLVVAATRNALFYVSTNGGASWTPQAFPGEQAGILHALELDPRASGTWYAGLEGENAWNSGVYKTTDAGRTWTLLAGMKGKAIWSLTIWPQDADVIAAGARDGVYLSRDAGSTWSGISPASNAELQPVVSLAFHPTESRILYAGTLHLPWRTTDGGATWESIHGGMHDDSDVFSIRVDPANPERVFASACSGVYRSANEGVLWTRLPTPLGAFRTYFVSLDPRHSGALFAGTSAGLVRSENDGASWVKVTTQQIKSIAYDPVHDGRILFASTSGGVLASGDEGRTVHESDQGFVNHSFTALAGTGKVLYASSVYEPGAAGLWRSDDFGDTWTPLAGRGIGGNILALAAAPNHPETVYAAGYRTLWKSVAAGRWMVIPGPRTAGQTTALLALSPERLLAGTANGLFERSAKGLWKLVLLAGTGRSRPQCEASEAGGPLRCAGVDLLTGGASRVDLLQRSGEKAIAAVTSAGAFVSEDTGETWKACGPLSESAPWYALAVDPAGDGTALAATSRGLFRSTDHCATWTAVRGVESGTVSFVVFHPTEPGVAFASQYGGIVSSTDGGVHWQPVDVGERHGSWPSTLLVLAAAPERLFALQPRRGVMYCSIGRNVAATRSTGGR